MKFDNQQALDFLKTLTGRAKPVVTFQTFDDNKERGDRFLAEHRHGELPGSLYQYLKRRNQDKGAGVFVMVNEGDGLGRKTENVTKVRALFLDTDGAPMEPARDALRPHIIVESSPGKFHLYWKVDDCPRERFTVLQKAIALRFGGDVSVSDLPRVMRLPGFYHQKGEPVMTRLVKAEDFPSYKVAQIIEGLGLGDGAETEAAKPATSLSVVARADGNKWEYVDKATGEIFDLQAWVVRHPDFRIATALRENAPSHVLNSSLQDGKQHILCPFDHEHTAQGDANGTYAVDGESVKRSSGFVVHCCHAHCANRDRLDFIKEMLAKGWIPLSALIDPRFLADERRPKKVYHPGDELQKHPGFLQLSPTERGHFMYLFEHVGCFIETGGSVPDDNKTICRHLGIVVSEWEELRELFIEVGLCRVADRRLVADLIANEDASATRAYNASIRKARAGGSKTQGTQAPA